jgi:hypothetical protein
LVGDEHRGEREHCGENFGCFHWRKEIIGRTRGQGPAGIVWRDIPG